MKLEIKDWTPGLISGLEVQLINEVEPSGDYFDWRPSSVISSFGTTDISGGTVEGHHKKLEYTKVEYHIDCEIFYFVSGEGIMLFCDLENGQAVPDSFVMLRVKEGMQLSVAPYKAHFVPISLIPDKPIKAVVISPKMDAIMVDLVDTVEV